jgi:hypothetical protein
MLTFNTSIKAPCKAQLIALALIERSDPEDSGQHKSLFKSGSVLKYHLHNCLVISFRVVNMIVNFVD